MFMKSRLFAIAFLLFPALANAQVLVPADPNLAPLAIKSQRVSVEVKDQVTRTHIEQVFVSHVNQQLEATYVFPIPDHIAVSEFAMWMNGKKVKGDVLEANEARGIYERIVAQVKDPGLLEYAGQRLLRCRVFPIPARGEQKIEIEYGEIVKIEGGVGRYIYPLATGGKSTRVKDDLSVRVMLSSKVPLKSVYSPSHKVSVDRKGETNALVGFEEKGAALDRDFQLLWTVSEKDVGINLVSFRERESEDGFFVLMLAPKADVKESEIVPKDVVFIIDSSGSMDGGKMEKAKEALRFVLGTLRPQDRFNVVRFSTGVESWSEGLVDASKNEIERARKFVAGIDAAGGTAIDDALAEGLKMVKPSSGRTSMIVFMTDGEPTVGETDPSRIIANVDSKKTKGVRIFSFGVGVDLNAMLLDRLANENGGVPEYATADEEIELKMSSFAAKVNSPVMTDLAIEFGKTQVYDVYPKQIPDLFEGGQLTVFGRYKGNGGASAVTLTGSVQGRKVTIVNEGSFEKGASEEEDVGSFIPRLWGTRKVGFLIDEIRLKGEKPELRDEVISLARRYGIVTPWTSYLVVEDTEVAANLPRNSGWNGNGPRPTPTSVAVMPRPARRAEGKAAAQSRAPAGAGGTFSESSPSIDSSVSGDDWGGGAEYAPSEPAMNEVAVATGDTGVYVSKSVKDKKEKEQLDSGEMSGVKRAGGRAFIRAGGVWRDADYKGGEQVLRVKYLSEAWFALARSSSKIKQAFALGERVTIVTSKGKAIVVTPDGGIEKISDAEIKKWL